MFRQKFLGFTGGVMLAYGVIIAIQGSSNPALLLHAASGVPMWCGLLFVMTGCGNMAEAFSRKKKRSDDFPFSITVILCNFVALIVAAICIGFLTWGTYSVLDESNAASAALGAVRTAQVEIYSSITVAAIFILILSTIAMFVDCCSFSFARPIERPGYYADYPPRQVPAIYKA